MTYSSISRYKVSNPQNHQSNSKQSRTIPTPKGYSTDKTASRAKKQMICIVIWLLHRRWEVGVKQMICWWAKRVAVGTHHKYIKSHSTIWKECMLTKTQCLKLRGCRRWMRKIESLSIVKIKLMPMKKVERQAFPLPYSLGNTYHFSNDNY